MAKFWNYIEQSDTYWKPSLCDSFCHLEGCPMFPNFCFLRAKIGIYQGILSSLTTINMYALSVTDNSGDMSVVAFVLNVLEAQNIIIWSHFIIQTVMAQSVCPPSIQKNLFCVITQKVSQLLNWNLVYSFFVLGLWPWFSRWEKS